MSRRSNNSWKYLKRSGECWREVKIARYVDYQSVNFSVRLIVRDATKLKHAAQG